MIGWRPIGPTPFDYLNLLNDAVARVHLSNPDILLPVRDDVQVIASDYSGQHRGANFETYTFLVTTESGLWDWVRERDLFRERWLPDGRRMSFKQLSERMRRRALLPFLDAARVLNGNLITVMIGASVGSWVEGGPAALKAELPECFPANEPLGTVEKMLRLASLIALLNGWLRDEVQESRWLSDADETLATFERREGFAKLAAYLSYGITGWKNPADQRFFTTAASSLPVWAEDLLAIPDLVAGAYSSGANMLPSFMGAPTWTVRMESERVTDARAFEVLDWLAAGTGALRHLLLRLERDDQDEVRASAQYFRGRVARI